MIIEVFSDTICPWCLIGKRRLERALDAWEGPAPEIRWRAFQLNPEMPAEGMDRREYLSAKFGGPERAAQVYDSIVQAGASERIPFAFDAIERTPNTVNSHRLIRFAGDRGDQTPVVQALFDAYFLNGRDIGDLDVLCDAAEQGGLAREEVRAYLESDRDIVEVRSEDAQGRRMGINGVPFFVAAGKYALSGAQPPEVLIRMFGLGAGLEAEEQPAHLERPCPV